VNPALPIARKLIEQGHEVCWYTGRKFQAAVEATGARFVPIVEASDPVSASMDERYPERAGLEGLRAFKFDLKYHFLDQIAAQIRDVRNILAGFPADVLLVDTGFLAAAMLHELDGTRFATYGITALPIGSRDTAPFGTGLPPGRSPFGRLRNRFLTAITTRLLFRDVQRHYQQVRADLGLARSSSNLFVDVVSPYLYLHASTASFEYPRRDLPAQVHFIGPLLPDVTSSFEPPHWWHRLDGTRPVVLVNQGTVAVDLDDLVAPTLAALADRNVLVIATGGAGVEGLTGAIPANAQVEPFVPFGALMPHVDVMITNGGFGGVQFALSHGVPLVVAGTTEDKLEVAARVAWSGAGIDLRKKRPTSDQMRDAVDTILGDGRYRDNARRIQRDIADHDAPTTAARLLERLIRTWQPVLRAEADEPSSLTVQTQRT
jgi:UDP:flavonoid glycosyltransferase YjiC (YdhE family)